MNDTSTATVKIDHFHNIFFGGDQLTVVRARGAQHVRENSVDGVGRLDGLVPVCEDWHASVVLLSVSLVIILLCYTCSYNFVSYITWYYTLGT